MSANDRRRAYGTGSLELRTDNHGRETYYGRFRTGGKQHKVKLGEKRKPGEKTGLTKSAAERARQKIIDNEIQRPPIGERIDLATAGDRYLTHLAEVMKRKPSTIQDYEIMLRKHLVPFFAGRSTDRIDTQLVGDFLLAKQRDGLSSKTVANQLTFTREATGARRNPGAPVARCR